MGGGGKEDMEVKGQHPANRLISSDVSRNFMNTRRQADGLDHLLFKVELIKLKLL